MDKHLFNYSGLVSRVVDGDTFDCMVDMGMSVHHKARIRIMGVDTPERGEDGYEEAKLFANERLGFSRVKLSSYKKDSFGRWLCQVWIDGDKDEWDMTWTLSEQIIDAGVGKPYLKRVR